LNGFAALPKPSQREVRARLQHILDPGNGISIPSTATESIQHVAMHLPIRVSEFTDFSCSKDHVLNAGEAITKTRKLPPGFLHFPVGYAGRSSSIIVSGTPLRRPLGQYRDENTGNVIYGPTRQLDYELEIACIIGEPLLYGGIITAADAEDHIFGLVLLNDWSGISRPLE
jgi:fumarylacetoacetase